MGEDINVKSIQLLEAYQKCFREYSSAVQQKIISYDFCLERSLNAAMQSKSHIHSIAERIRHKYNNAKSKLMGYMAQKPPVPSQIAIAIKRVQEFKEADKKAKKYDEQCEKVIKKMRANIELARQQNARYKNEFGNMTERGSSFLQNCIFKLKSYSGQNG